MNTPTQSESRIRPMKLSLQPRSASTSESSNSSRERLFDVLCLNSSKRRRRGSDSNAVLFNRVLTPEQHQRLMAILYEERDQQRQAEDIKEKVGNEIPRNSFNQKRRKLKIEFLFRVVVTKETFIRTLGTFTLHTHRERNFLLMREHREGAPSGFSSHRFLRASTMYVR